MTECKVASECRGSAACGRQCVSFFVSFRIGVASAFSNRYPFSMFLSLRLRSPSVRMFKTFKTHWLFVSVSVSIFGCLRLLILASKNKEESRAELWDRFFPRSPARGSKSPARRSPSPLRRSLRKPISQSTVPQIGAEVRKMAEKVPLLSSPVS